MKKEFTPSPSPVGGSRGRLYDFLDTFKAAEGQYVELGSMTDIERAAYNTSHSKLKAELSSRHLLTLAVGGAIGTGLFVNSGQILANGIGSVLVAFAITSTMMYATINALGELAVAFPVNGGFTTYITRFVEPSIAFAVNLNYLAQWAVLLPLELVAASITIRFWNSTINSDAWVAIFYAAIFCINLLDVKALSEAGFVLSSIKILAIIGFTIMGIVLICGGGPKHEYIGSKFWHKPDGAAFVGGFKGLCNVFITAAFSYSGTELIGLSCSECANPRKTLSSAAKQVFWLITICYMVSLAIVGTLVPYNDPRLLDASSSVDAAASPFVIAIERGAIHGLPSLMNAIILIAVLSVANSAVYACSRTVASMADHGDLPQVFSYIDKKGRPVWATLVTLFFGLLSFIAASDKQQEVFTWLSALSGLSTLFCWFAINLAHIRFRRALSVQGRGTDELTFVSPTGVWGSVYGCVIVLLAMAASFWVSLFPEGEANAKSFFQSYLSLPILIVCYLGHKAYKRSWKLLYVRAKDIDLDTGRKCVDLEVLKNEVYEERRVMQEKPVYYRVFKFFC